MMITKQTATKVNELICTLCDNVASAGNPAEQVEGIARLIDSLGGSAYEIFNPVVGFETGGFCSQEEADARTKRPRTSEVDVIVNKIKQGIEASMKSGNGISS
ncbi:hypothetical protein PMSM_14680 [Paenibacillus macquariensis subsp. macquariensis]|nr:hypothetical protein PMSM_14680 [Paenibacillus macquariensis subsp. macquariensis]